MIVINEELEFSERFLCSGCGIHLEVGTQIIYDEDGEYEYQRSYEFVYCPNCGSKIED